MWHLPSVRRAIVAHLGQAILIVAILISTQAIAQTEYKLQPGDILEVAVTGIPDFRQRLPVELSGNVAVPLAGPLKVVGLTLTDARALITKALSNQVYVQSTNVGPDIQRLILPKDVMVTVAEYRPIYVGGHVARPGAYPFRAGMTVRQAIAVAGGTNLIAGQAANPLFQTADLRAQAESLSAELAMEQDRIRQLRSDLGLEQTKSPPTPVAGLSPALRKRLSNLSRQYHDARKTDRASDKSILKNSIDAANMQLTILAKKKQNDEEASQADASDYAKVRELFKKGISANARLAETRRTMMLSADQLLQTVVEMSNVERQRGDYQRQFDKIDNQARIDEWRELQQATLRYIQVSAQLKSANEKLTGVASAPAGASPNQSAKLDVMVYRSGEKGMEQFAADQNMVLTPGDTVEVTVETQYVASQ